MSVVIPVLNEEKNLARCLRSTAWADEVFIVDSGSRDSTEGIAESFGAKVVQFKEDKKGRKKKNWALQTLPFKHEWVFFLDADEEVPDGAEEEIREICTVNKKECDGYLINRRFLFMAKWMKHAYYPNWNLRLFKRHLGRYETLTDRPTASGDVEIHERVLLDGKCGRLGCELKHYAFPSVEVFVEKHNRYSNWEAVVQSEKLSRETDSLRPGSRGLMWRRWIKNATEKLPCRPFLRFLYVYVMQRGILDGKEGYYFARLHSYYEFLTVCKIYERKKQKKTR